MSQHLWTPAAEAQGISLDVLADIIAELQSWRTSYLSQVGVPTNFAPEWDFVSAVSACTFIFLALTTLYLLITISQVHLTPRST